MNRLLSRAAFAAAAALALSCTGVTPDEENPSDNNTPNDQDKPTSYVDGSDFLKENSSEGLTINVSTSLLQIGKERAYFIVRNDGQILSGGYKIYETGASTALDLPKEWVKAESGEFYELPYWEPSSPESKSFWATYKTENTKLAPVKIIAVDIDVPERVEDPDQACTSFKHRSLVFDFTGAGCGYCPNMIAAIDDLIEAEGAEFADKAVVAEVHTFKMSHELAPEEDISSAFGVLDYPTVIIDLSRTLGNYQYSTNVSNLRKALNTTLALTPKAGISARYGISGNTLLSRATVKAAEDGEYRIGMWVLEDGLYAVQANYDMKGTDYPFDYHDDVLRIPDSKYAPGNYSGHSLGVISKGEYADWLFCVTLKEEWIKKNCHLVFFVTDASKGVITNVIKTDSLEGSYPFDYEK